MPRSATQTRRQVLEAAYELFYQKGFTRVGLDLVAHTAGVTKRTLYNHFQSKDALLAAVLEFHSELALSRIERWGEKLGGDLGELIDGLFGELASWAKRHRWEGAGYTRLVMELADLPGHPAHAIARRHKCAVEDWLTARLAEREVVSPADRAREVMVLIEGSMALILIHRDPNYAKSAARAAKGLIMMSDGT